MNLIVSNEELAVALEAAVAAESTVSLSATVALPIVLALLSFCEAKSSSLENIT